MNNGSITALNGLAVYQPAGQHITAFLSDFLFCLSKTSVQTSVQWTDRASIAVSVLLLLLLLRRACSGLRKPSRVETKEQRINSHTWCIMREPMRLVRKLHHIIGV